MFRREVAVVASLIDVVALVDARVAKVANPENLGLLVEEGQDIMLMLSLLCCIEHMHNIALEKEQERLNSVSSSVSM